MKIIFSSRRHHYVARVSIFLVTVALIAGMVGCGQPAYNLTITSTAGGSVTTLGEGTFTYDEGTVVSPDGWGWQKPEVQGNSLYDIWGSSGSDMFAVGEYGTILHYDGISWELMSSGTTAHLWSVWGSSPTDVFAGGAGVILHYDGYTWSQINSDCGHILSVWGSSSYDVFAGTYYGILHYNGQDWTQVAWLPNYSVHGIWGSSATDVYAVGSSDWSAENPNHLIIYHYDGYSWLRIYESSSYTLGLAIWGSSSSNIFVVGYSYEGYAPILHYDGITWGEIASNTAASLNAVWGTSASDVYVAGSSGTILHYDGITWVSISSAAQVHLRGIWGGSSNDVFVVGECGIIMHYDGIAWSVMGGGTSYYSRFHSIWGSSISDIFAVGDSGVLHYDGNNWTEVYSGGCALNDIWGSSASDVWVVGYGGALAHYDGNSWLHPNYHFDGDLWGVWGSSASDVFAVGAGYSSGDGRWYGTILHYDGNNWSRVDFPDGSMFYDVWGSSSSDVFAVGNGGTVFHYDGNTWSQMSAGLTGYLGVKYEVWCSSPTDVFVAGPTGALGTIYHYDGVTWSELDTNTDMFLAGIWGTSATDIFAWGQGIIHFDGNTWTDMKCPSGVSGVWGIYPSDVFAVGEGGMILHYPEPAISSVNPNHGDPCESLIVTITGTCLNGATTLNFGSGITINSFTVNSSTEISSSITIDMDAQPGARNISVITPEGTAKKLNGFVVAPPTIASVNPTCGTNGETMNVTINGNYLAGATRVSFGSGITVNSFIVDSSTQIIATISISGSATAGARDVLVTTPGGTAMLSSGFTVIQPNQPPNQPSNVSPANEATGISLTPTLQSSVFSDPDLGDSHAASQWQIRTSSGSYSSPVFDTGVDDSNLTSITVPSGVLSYSTTYYWHVRYQDNHDAWSSWSAETSFTTAALPSTAEVATDTGTGTATFTAGSGTIENLTAIAENALPPEAAEGKPNVEFPHGFFSFNITGLTSGATVTITIELPLAVPVGTQYWKYGPTPDNPTDHWYQIPMGHDDGDNVITITLVDGDLGDDDLTANGVIVDQGGPGNPPAPPLEGCFIATAAYGTPMAEEIQILREFRDEYLLTNPAGQALVGLYYNVSPPMAEFITEHPSLKPIVRAGLLPAVAISTVVVNTTPSEKMTILGLLVLVSVALAVWAKRRRGRGPEYT
jgi:hypothetical protein